MATGNTPPLSGRDDEIEARLAILLEQCDDVYRGHAADAGAFDTTVVAKEYPELAGALACLRLLKRAWPLPSTMPADQQPVTVGKFVVEGILGGVALVWCTWPRIRCSSDRWR